MNTCEAHSRSSLQKPAKLARHAVDGVVEFQRCIQKDDL